MQELSAGMGIGIHVTVQNAYCGIHIYQSTIIGLLIKMFNIYYHLSCTERKPIKREIIVGIETIR